MSNKMKKQYTADELLALYQKGLIIVLDEEKRKNRNEKAKEYYRRNRDVINERNKCRYYEMYRTSTKPLRSNKSDNLQNVSKETTD